MKKGFVFVILAAILSSGIITCDSLVNDPWQKPADTNREVFAGEITRSGSMNATITIDGPSGIAAFPNKTGTGSQVDPFQIENLRIIAAANGSCIIINNTRDHIIIKNCSFQGNANPDGFNYANIVIFNASRITFDNCSVINGSYGFIIERSFNLTLRDNHVSGADTRCVYLSQTNETRIYNNTVEYSGGGGIDLVSRCYRNLLISNRCQHCTLFGISIIFDSKYNIVVGNDLCFNHDGIVVWSGVTNNNLYDNNASFNRGYGAYMWLAFNFSFNNNIVSNNGDHGIFMSGCSNVTISVNTITGNGGHGVHFWEYFGSYGCKFLSNTMAGNALGCFSEDLSQYTGLGTPNAYDGNGCLPPSTGNPAIDELTVFLIACAVVVVTVCTILLILRRSQKDGYWVLKS